MDGSRSHNQDHYVEDQATPLDVILLTYFSNDKAKYNSICGKLRGYQKGSSDGIHKGNIDAPYLEGISITVDNPRKHVWSYGVGNNYKNAHTSNCPCSLSTTSNSPPAFVNEHYYCESGGANGESHNTFYESDPLWDGRGCPSTSNCCSTLGPPWFYHHFTEHEMGAVEVRICCDEVYSNEATLLEQVELYVQ